MAVSLQNQALSTRPCVFCGKSMLAHLTRCPHCREDVPQVQLSSRKRTGGRHEIRRGLLYMLLAGVIQYFVAGCISFTLPIAVPPLATPYLAPVVFLSGFGLAMFGCYHRP